MSRTCTFTPCRLHLDIRKVGFQKLSHARLVIVPEELKEGGILPLLLSTGFQDVAGDGNLPFPPPFCCVRGREHEFEGGEFARRLGRVPWRAVPWRSGSG